jgi:biotin carboxylase
MSPAGEIQSNPLPRLAFAFDPGSFAPLALLEASRGICELLWVVDATRPDVVAVERLLRRLGTVVDVAGLSPDEIAATVASHQPVGVLGLADDTLTFTATLAERLGLPFHTPACAARLTDKSLQRAALRDFGLVTPRSWLVHEGVAVGSTDLARELTFPAVLKPRHGEASRDTYRVETLEDLDRLLLAGGARAVRRELVLEGYIADAAPGAAGDGFAGYVSVESFVEDGVVTHLAVTGRTPPAPPFRETGFFIPSALPDAVRDEVLVIAASAAHALGVTVGCLHTEIKLTPDGPVVIEVNGRIGGGVPEMLIASTDVAFLEIAMRLALRQPVVVDGPLSTACVAFLFYVHAPDDIHIVESIDGIDEVKSMSGVQEVILRRGPGSAVDWHEGNHGHVLSVFGTVADHDELRRMIDDVATTLVIQGT